MRTIVLMLTGLLLAVAVSGQQPERRKAESFWPNGTRKSLGLVKKMPTGELVKDGRFTSWFENGKKQSEETWKEGVREGPGRYWDENGNLVEQKYFRAGKPHGRQIFYWPNGKAQSEQNYQEGVLTGKETFWYSNGRKALERHRVDGKIAGTWQSWNRNGGLQETRTYESGRLVDTSSPSRKRSQSSGGFEGRASEIRDYLFNSYRDDLDQIPFKVTTSEAPDSGLLNTYEYEYSASNYEPPDVSNYEPPDVSNYEPPEVSDYEPPDISDYGL